MPPRPGLKASLDLPPMFRLVTLREVGDAFEYAKAHASELGAGALIYVGRFDLAEFAVVLEPDEPLRSARRAFYAGMAALTDALTAHAPPEKPITCGWPAAIYVDHGLIGGARLAWPDRSEDAPPDWLVFGGMIRTHAPVHILQGMADPDVPWRHALRLVEHMSADPVTLSFIADGDHRLSRPQDLAQLAAAVDLVAGVKGQGLFV